MFIEKFIQEEPRNKQKIIDDTNKNIIVHTGCCLNF